MTARFEIPFAQLAEMVGTDLGESAGRQITRADVEVFADLTDDHQWIHLDSSRAERGPFGTTIVHGFLTLSLIPHFLDQLLAVRNTSMGVNYGLDRVRFPSVVPVGAVVKARGRLTSVDMDEHATTARVTVQLTFVCDGSDKPACVADLVILFVK